MSKYPERSPAERDYDRRRTLASLDRWLEKQPPRPTLKQLFQRTLKRLKLRGKA